MSPAGGPRHEDGVGQVFYWPTISPVTARLTPRQAWRAWLFNEITAEDFGRILNAWEHR